MLGAEERAKHSGRVIAKAGAYAAGLFWQPADDPNRVASEARTVAATEGVDADFYCVSQGTVAQYGLGWRMAGHTAGLRPLALSVTESLDGSFIGAFRIGSQFWFGYAHNGVVLPEGDILYDDEAECRAHFEREYRDSPSECVAYCPEEWELDNTTALDIDSAIGKPISVRLRSTENIFARMRAAILLFIIVVAAVAGSAYWFLQQQVEQDSVNRQNARINEQAKANEEPWRSMPMPSNVLASCHAGFNRLPIVVPGWSLEGGSCTGQGPSRTIQAEWTLETGYLQALRVASEATGFDMTVTNSGEGAQLLTMVNLLEAARRTEQGVDRGYDELWGGQRVQEFLWELRNRLAVDSIVIEGTPPRGVRRHVTGVDGQELPAYQPAPSMPFEISSNVPIRAWSGIFDNIPGTVIENITWDASNGMWKVSGTIYVKYSGDVRS